MKGAANFRSKKPKVTQNVVFKFKE